MTTSDEKKDGAYRRSVDEAHWKTGRNLYLWRPALEPPMWLAMAPAEVRTLLTLITLIGLVHAFVTLLLVPFGWLVNLVTRRRFNSIWGFRVVRATRTPILVAGFPWLLSFLSPAVAWVAFGWMLVYLVLRLFNGSADQERRALVGMEGSEKWERSVRG